MTPETEALLRKAGILLPEKGTYVIDIPSWRPATLNELTKRGNHFSAAAIKKADREIIAGYAAKFGVAKATRKRRVSLVVTIRDRRYETDPDSIHKSLLDGLKRSGLLVDDSPAWVEIGPFEQVKGAKLATRIILEDL